MTAVTPLDVVLVAVILVTAWWTIGARDVMEAIAALMGTGVLIALAWMRLGAPDVALTESAIGAGLTGFLLLRACGAERASVAATAAETWRIEPGAARPPRAVAILTIALGTVVTAGLGVIVVTLPEPPPSLAPLAAAHLPATGLGNAVNGVLVSYRAIDTLIEMVVVMLALVGVWSLSTDAAWSARPQLHTIEGGAMRLTGRVLPPLGLVIGAFLSWNGADEPGGAFPGGSVIAAMLLILLSAGLVRVPPVTSTPLRLVLALGPGSFIAVGMIGWWLAGGVLSFSPGDPAKAQIVVIEIMLTVSIAVTMALLVIGAPRGVPRS